MPGFGGPDVFLQPAHQRQVVGHAAHQRHRGVRVQVDESGNQDVPGQVDPGVPGVGLEGLRCREHGFDRAVTHGHAVMLEDHAGRFDRHDPPGADQGRGFTGHRGHPFCVGTSGEAYRLSRGGRGPAC